MDYLSDLGERFSNTALKVGDDLVERYEKSGLKENVGSHLANGLDNLSKVGQGIGVSSNLSKDLTKQGKFLELIQNKCMMCMYILFVFIESAIFI